MTQAAPHSSPVGSPGDLTVLCPLVPECTLEKAFTRQAKAEPNWITTLSLFSINTCFVRLLRQASITQPGALSAQHNLLSSCLNISSFATY